MHVLALFALALAAPRAHAFEARSSMGAWTPRQVERDYVLPKGWLAIELAADSKTTGAVRDENGARSALDEGTAWHYSRLWLKVDQGFARRFMLYAHIPLVHAWLTNDEGANTSTFALGDIHTGFWLQPWLARRGVLALQVDLKAPSGVEWPSDFIGGANNTSGFLTGTGITNLGAILHARQQLGSGLALRGCVGYVHKFPQVVGYVIEDEGFGNGWLSAGDETRVGLEVQLQAADAWAVDLGARYSHRAVYRMGNSGQSASSLVLETIANSTGDFVDTGLGVSFSPNQHFEAGLDLDYQLMGSDTRLFGHLGLEEFSPQPGLTVTLQGVLRW